MGRSSVRRLLATCTASQSSQLPAGLYIWAPSLNAFKDTVLQLMQFENPNTLVYDLYDHFSAFKTIYELYILIIP